MLSIHQLFLYVVFLLLKHSPSLFVDVVEIPRCSSINHGMITLFDPPTPGP